MNKFVLHENLFFIIWLGVIFCLEQYKQRFFVPTNIEDGGLQRWIKNCAFGIINRFLVGPLILLPIVIWATNFQLFHRPLWMTGISALAVDILILDLASYCFHRMSHWNSILWQFHEVHHLDSAFDTTTGLRIHFGELILQGAFRAACIVLLAIPIKSVLFFETLLVMEGLFHHSNICIPETLEKLLSYVIITPCRHAVHHHATIQDTDSNYGFIFVFWDKFFHSFNKSKRKDTWHIGLEYAPDLDCIKLLTSPFRFTKLKHRMKLKGYKTIEETS